MAGRTPCRIDAVRPPRYLWIDGPEQDVVRVTALKDRSPSCETGLAGELDLPDLHCHRLAECLLGLGVEMEAVDPARPDDAAGVEEADAEPLGERLVVTGELERF